MATIHTIKLAVEDIFQILDALNSRANSYQQTACYMSGQGEENESLIIEECRDAVEAKEITQHIRDITESIECQM